ncbi:MAG: J domain-containing protein, partial [Ilumatobacteraceae bacterium]
MSDTSDCFEILGLDAEQADEGDVVRARRRLAAQFHPDRGGDPSRMVEVNAATDQSLRHIALLARGGSGPE